MKRVASVIRVHPDKEADYRALHAAVWPRVLEVLSEAHVRNYSIFLRDGLLFSYLEYVGEDFEGDMQRASDDEAMKRWVEVVMPCQQPLASAGAGEWWADAEEVFHLD